jgi:hypothetical protein
MKFYLDKLWEWSWNGYAAVTGPLCSIDDSIKYTYFRFYGMYIEDWMDVLQRESGYETRRGPIMDWRFNTDLPQQTYSLLIPAGTVHWFITWRDIYIFSDPTFPIEGRLSKINQKKAEKQVLNRWGLIDVILKSEIGTCKKYILEVNL